MDKRRDAEETEGIRAGHAVALVEWGLARVAGMLQRPIRRFPHSAPDACFRRYCPNRVLGSPLFAIAAYWVAEIVLVSREGNMIEEGGMIY